MSQPVIIRSAQKEDVPAIWHLLHSDYNSMDLDIITSNYQSFYVLLYGTQLLAVYDNSLRGVLRRKAPTVHPMYPQKLMETAMTNIMDGIFKRPLSCKSRNLFQRE